MASISNRRKSPAQSAQRSAQVIIGAFLKGLGKLLDVSVLFIFLLLFFGIIGVILWKGTFRYRCSVAVANQTLTPAGCVVPRGDVPGPFENQLCSPTWGYQCEWDLPVCSCDHGNPWEGKQNFDNVGSAALTLLVSVTLEGWSTIMYMTEVRPPPPSPSVTAARAPFGASAGRVWGLCGGGSWLEATPCQSCGGVTGGRLGGPEPPPGPGLFLATQHHPGGGGGAGRDALE